MQWNACVHRVDLGLYSHPKVFWGNGVRTHVNSKGKISSTGKILPKRRIKPWRWIKQDSDPNTLPTSYSGPGVVINSSDMSVVWSLLGQQPSTAGVGSVNWGAVCIPWHWSWRSWHSCPRQVECQLQNHAQHAQYPKSECDNLCGGQTVTYTTRRANAQTIYICHKGLLHSYLPYIVNHHEHLSCFIKLFSRMTAQVLALPWPCDLGWTSSSFKLESTCRV